MSHLFFFLSHISVAPRGPEPTQEHTNRKQTASVSSTYQRSSSPNQTPFLSQFAPIATRMASVDTWYATYLAARLAAAPRRSCRASSSRWQGTSTAALLCPQTVSPPVPTHKTGHVSSQQRQDIRGGYKHGTKQSRPESHKACLGKSSQQPRSF
eukprot:COSAG06_NODE_6965_length_2671_cov_1.977649_2_plen_154_part_00